MYSPFVNTVTVRRAVTLVLSDRDTDYGMTTDWPFDVLLVHPNDFYAPSSLARALNTLSVDFLLICEAEALVTAGRELARLLGARLVYDVHDDEAALAASLGEPPEVVGRYEASQRAALGIADYVIVATHNEEEMAARAQVAPDRITLLPNGADPHQRRCWGPNIEAATLVFLGNLCYGPNARAVSAIRTVILPSLRAAGVDVRVRVVGRGPAELMRPGEGVEFAGRVETINEALRDVTLALAPLTAGSGAKVKVVDYLAAGLPVLGTSEAVTGLSPDHPGVLVENDLRAWPSLITTLLRDATALRKIGQAGRQCVERDLRWQQIGKDLARHAHAWLTTAPLTTAPDAVTCQTGVPRWLAEHAGQDALGDPQTTSPGRPRWVRRARTATRTAPRRRHSR